MSITHIKTEAYVRACLREKKITRIVDVIFECPDCGTEVFDSEANYCRHCRRSFADLQHKCEGCGAGELMISSGPHCELCGHKRAPELQHPLNVAQTILNHRAAQQ